MKIDRTIPNNDLNIIIHNNKERKKERKRKKWGGETYTFTDPSAAQVGLNVEYTWIEINCPMQSSQRNAS